MGSKMGRAIVANSSIQVLLKQSSSAVDVLSDVFKLTEEEKKRLANSQSVKDCSSPAKTMFISNRSQPDEKNLVDTRPQQPRNRHPEKTTSRLNPVHGYIDPEVNPPQRPSLKDYYGRARRKATRRRTRRRIRPPEDIGRKRPNLTALPGGVNFSREELT